MFLPRRTNYHIWVTLKTTVRGTSKNTSWKVMETWREMGISWNEMSWNERNINLCHGWGGCSLLCWKVCGKNNGNGWHASQISNFRLLRLRPTDSILAQKREALDVRYWRERPNDLGVTDFVLIPTHNIYIDLGVVQLGEFRPRGRSSDQGHDLRPPQLGVSTSCTVPTSKKLVARYIRRDPTAP